MELRIKNILVETNGRWLYSGTVIHNTKTFPVSGTVSKYHTQGMVKRAIIEDVKKNIAKATAEKKEKIKILTPDENFTGGS